MININLLGKKKTAAVPFGLSERFEKMGLTTSDLSELGPGLVRLAALAIGLYAANYVPNYYHQQKVNALEAQVQKYVARSEELQKELATKKDIRKQMDQLNKEEADLQRQLNAVSALQQGRSTAFATLSDVVSQLEKSKKVWIDDIRYENKRVSLKGRSWEYLPVYDFVKSITESTRYTNVIFREVAAEDSKYKIAGVPPAAQKTKRFALEFDVKEGE